MGVKVVGIAQVFFNACRIIEHAQTENVDFVGYSLVLALASRKVGFSCRFFR